MTDPAISLDDEAARAGWLYYVGGLTQDQIASELGLSRQRAQRLVARAMTEGLIQVRLNHPIASCLRLEADLARRYDLGHCRVAPSLGAGADPNRAIAGPAAALIESFLRRPEPLTIALGTGRALRSAVEALAPVEAPQHRIVSLIGNIAPDGSASFFDVIMRIADKVRAPHFPMPVPVLSDTPAERAMFHGLRVVREVVALARSADVTFVGVGQMGEDAPLHKDGFLSDSQLRTMQDRGAAGEVAGWVYDDQGRYFETGTNERVGGVRVEPQSPHPVIGIAAGPTKVPALRAALAGRILNGLVTDEPTATALLG